MASRLKLGKQTYLAWLNYANHPVCSANAVGQSLCETPVELVLPHEFIEGVSNHCAAHQCQSNHVVNG